MILAWKGDELSREQTSSSELRRIWFEDKFDLEGQGQSPSKTLGILTKLFYPLVQIWWSQLERVVARTNLWLTHIHTYKRTHTDAGNDNTRMPKLAPEKIKLAS